MALPDPPPPPDPFGVGPDLSQFGANSFAMYEALKGAGFTDAQAFEFAVRIQVAFVMKAPQ